MGCCGHDFVSKEKIKEAVKKNASEFNEFGWTERELVKFRDRALPRDLRDGVCRNLIEKDGRFICPLHPKQNKGRDLREGHCDVDYLCQTAKEFSGWSKEKQERFLEFIKSKKLNNLDYSIKMDDDSLLEGFE